jgi:hypothetical protein
MTNHPTRDVRRNTATVGGGRLSAKQGGIYKYIYTYIHTHTTSEKCAVVVRFKPEITLQPLSEFCIYLHNPKTR